MLREFDNLLVSASGDGAVRVWNLTTDSCVRTFDAHDNAILACSMNEDRTLHATGGVHDDVKIWRVHNESSS